MSKAATYSVKGVPLAELQYFNWRRTSTLQPMYAENGGVTPGPSCPLPVDELCYIYWGAVRFAANDGPAPKTLAEIDADPHSEIRAQNRFNNHPPALFPLGRLYSTCGVAELQRQEPGFVMHVWNALERYKRGDWGDMTASDKARNDEAVAAGEDGGRIFAAYVPPDNPDWKIWIITESDHSCTTILFPDEY